jgi:hypothetical protein
MALDAIARREVEWLLGNYSIQYKLGYLVICLPGY